jgi:hypothetical protein
MVVVVVVVARRGGPVIRWVCMCVCVCAQGGGGVSGCGAWVVVSSAAVRMEGGITAKTKTVL